MEIQSFDTAEIANNALNMPDAEAAEKASEFNKSHGGKKFRRRCGRMCRSPYAGRYQRSGVEKLDANLAKALVSIGAVKGVEIGDGFSVCTATGLTNNDAFHVNADGSIVKLTNHAGGILGGISDGSDIVVRAGFKPTRPLLLPSRPSTKTAKILPSKSKAATTRSSLHAPLLSWNA